MTREDFQMARNIIAEIGMYKSTLDSVNNKDHYMRIALTTSSGYEQARLNNPNVIGEEEQKKLNSVVRDYMRYLLQSKITKLEKELEEL